MMHDNFYIQKNGAVEESGDLVHNAFGNIKDETLLEQLDSAIKSKSTKSLFAAWASVRKAHWEQSQDFLI
jgi:hypothetical protein